MKASNGWMRVSLAALLLTLSGVSCISGAANTPKNGKPIPPPNVVAIVNGVPILDNSLKVAFEDRLPSTGHRTLSPERMREIRAEVLDQLIVQEILYQEATRQGVAVSKSEVATEMKSIQERFQSTDAYRASLETRGITEHELDVGIEKFLAIRKLTEQEIRSKIEVTDEEMRRYHAEHPEQFRRPQQVRLRILLISADPAGSQAEWDQARENAESLAQRVRNGEDFGELVKQFSGETAAKETGGDTGLLHEGTLPYAEIEGIANNFPLGQISEAVRTLYGYVIFRVEERQAATQMAFDDLNQSFFRRELERSEASKRINEWIEELKSKSEIEIR